MRLIVLQNEAMIADVVCGLEAVYVGSREGCRIQLPDARVAAQQVVIWPERNGVWTLKQLDGACEVRLNQMTVTGEADLKPGDEIQILDYAVRVYPDYDEKSPGRGALGTSRAALERFAQSKLPVGATLRKSDEPLTIHPAQLDAVARANTLALLAETQAGLGHRWAARWPGPTSWSPAASRSRSSWTRCWARC